METSRFISYYPLKQGLKLSSTGIRQCKSFPFISYYPLKQGLKLRDRIDPMTWRSIYILLSIKTRIETLRNTESSMRMITFISYYPLKQGLKLFITLVFTSYACKFISYYPLKQGLKLSPSKMCFYPQSIYILLSIKTRIET